LETTPRHVHLPELAEHLNERNRITRKLSRRAESICRVSLLRVRLRARELQREVDGVVVGIAGAGCFIACAGVEGLLGGRRLGGGANETETAWIAADGKKIELGQRVRVRIRKLDPVRGQIELELIR
jgi:exoribonuclease R